MAGPVLVKRLNVVGDKQADLTVRGGATKPSTSIRQSITPSGAKDCPKLIWRWALLGRTSRLKVCSKIAFKSVIGYRFARRSSSSRGPAYRASSWHPLDRPDMVKRFLASGRTGFYLRVLQEGGVTAGDAITIPEAAGSMTLWFCRTLCC